MTRPQNTMNNIHCCTWAKALKSRELAMLLESANRVGINIDVMQCGSFLEKPAALRNYLSTLPESDIVICTDGYDVLYVQGEETILSRFKDLNAHLVFSGEKQCCHHFPKSKAYFEQTGGNNKYVYLNSGLMIGYVGAFLTMLEEIRSMDNGLLKKELNDNPGLAWHDQPIFGLYACSNPGKVKIDTNSSIFWTMSYEKYDINKYAEISPDRISNLEAHTKPCVVHVSHRRKFYPVFLYIAQKLGIRLTSQNVDLQLFDQHIKGHISNIDKYVIPMDAGVRKAVEHLFKYRLIKLTGTFLEYKKSLRKYFWYKLLSKIKQLCWKVFFRHVFCFRQNVQKQACESAAIIFIGIGKYIDYFINNYYCNFLKKLATEKIKRGDFFLLWSSCLPVFSTGHFRDTLNVGNLIWIRRMLVLFANIRNFIERHLTP